MKKYVFISIALLTTLLMLWYSGNKPITNEELALIDPMWKSPGIGYRMNVYYSEKTLNDTITYKQRSFVTSSQEKKASESSFITSKISSSILKTGIGGYRY